MSSLPPPPDVLDSTGGQALPPPPRRARRPLVRGLVAAGGVVVLGAAGYGAWAAYSFFQTGPQPAQALPASTLGYVSIDLDPSGGQKIEALRTLDKFPAFKDKVGVTSSDDLREKLFDAVQGAGQCTSLDFARDVKPWLGQRAAVAAVDTGGDQPTEVVVVQVTDDDKADTGLAALRDCAGSDAGRFSWHIDGDWAVLGEKQSVVDQVADDASKHSLADDSDFQHWTGEVGDPGVVSMYAAPAAGAYLADHADELFSFPMAMTGMGTSTAYSDTSSGSSSGTASGSSSWTTSRGGYAPLGSSQVPDALKARLRDFTGAAATIRFANGGVELAVASDSSVSQGAALGGGAAAGDLVRSLPADTGAALGLGFADGWLTDALDQAASMSGQSATDLISTLEQASGLSLPQDVETLTGQAAAIAVGPGLTTDSLSGDPSRLPVALKVQGDPAAIKTVLAKLAGQAATAGLPEGLLGSDTAGDDIAIGPDADYRADVVGHGSLGDSATFRDVVPDADRASAILYVDLDRYDDLVKQLAGDDQQTLDNLEPLAGLGLAGWTDGGTSHLVLRISTD